MKFLTPFTCIYSRFIWWQSTRMIGQQPSISRFGLQVCQPVDSHLHDPDLIVETCRRAVAVLQRLSARQSR